MNQSPPQLVFLQGKEKIKDGINKYEEENKNGNMNADEQVAHIVKNHFYDADADADADIDIDDGHDSITDCPNDNNDSDNGSDNDSDNDDDESSDYSSNEVVIIELWN